MATQTDERRTAPRTSTKKPAAASAATALLSTMNPEMILDLVQRLGLVDMVVGKVKSRIEDADIDDILDEVVAYVRRNPEVLVVALGAVTVAAAVIVFLDRAREWDGSERRTMPRETSAPGRVRRTTTADAKRRASA